MTERIDTTSGHVPAIINFPVGLVRHEQLSVNALLASGESWEQLLAKEYRARWLERIVCYFKGHKWWIYQWRSCEYQLCHRCRLLEPYMDHSPKPLHREGQK